MQMRGNVVNEEVVAKLRVLDDERTACRNQAERLDTEYKGLEQSIENNVYTSLTHAQDTLERWLNQRAYEDCEGSYNVGEEIYTQDFVVDNKLYTATLVVEYGRWEKQYHYVDSSVFSYAEKIN